MNLLTLTLAADIERTPAVDAWVAEVEQLLNLEAQRQLSANAVDGAAVLHVRTPGKRFVIIDLTPHTVRFINKDDGAYLSDVIQADEVGTLKVTDADVVRLKDLFRRYVVEA